MQDCLARFPSAVMSSVSCLPSASSMAPYLLRVGEEAGLGGDGTKLCAWLPRGPRRTPRSISIQGDLRRLRGVCQGHGDSPSASAINSGG